jgi:signal transduction histidine kinase
MSASETGFNVSELVQLIRKMGHDIRAPLGSIMSTSEMFAEGYYDPLTPKQARANERIQRNSARVLTLLDDFVTYIKAEDKDIKPFISSFDPNASITEWCNKVKAYAEQKGLSFHLVFSEQIPTPLQGDPTIISRIVQALLWNAVAFTREGDIWLESDWTPQDGWTITVRDSGIGIPTEDRPHIFEPFWRGQERPQVPTAGAGLGLAVSSALARLLNGELSLKETDPKGSTFSVRLPFKIVE